MSNVVRFPERVSPDGHEIWDWAAKLGSVTQKLDRIAYLRRVVNASGRCGCCRHWMKSRECPREHNVNGHSRGPSMSERPCLQFVWDAGARRLRDEREAEANALAASLSGDDHA